MFEFGRQNATGGVSWSFRVTAYDAHGNPSTVSDASAGATPQKVDTALLAADAVTVDILAAGSVVAASVVAASFTGAEFSATVSMTVGTGNDIVRISGADAIYRLWIGHATAASAPFRVTKAGVVTMTKAVMSTDPSADDRVDITTDAVSVYAEGVVCAYMKSLNVGSGGTLGAWLVKDTVSQSASNPTWVAYGYAMLSLDGGQLGIPGNDDIENEVDTITMSGFTCKTIRWDDTNGKLLVGSSTFSPD